MADRIFAIAALAIGGIFLHESRFVAEKKGVQTFSSAFFPRLIIYMLIFLSIMLLIKSFLNSSKRTSRGTFSSFLREHWRVPFMFGWFIVYLILMPAIGFIPSTIIFLLLGFLVLNTSFVPKRLLLYIPLSLALTFAIHFVFEKKLSIMLP